MSERKKMKKKVQVVLVNENKLVLFKTNKKRGSFWQNVTGSVEGEESFLAGAKREVQEETGLENSEFFNLDYQFTFLDQWDHEAVEETFLGVIKTQDPKIIIDPKEHDEFQWIEIDSVEKGHFKFPSNHTAFLKAIEKYKSL